MFYGFTAVSIQKYITASSRLRDIQGASQIVEDLCGPRFTRTVKEVGLPEDCILSAAAGGVRLKSDNSDALRRLHAVWPLIAQQVAPGLKIHQALLPVGEGGMANAMEKLNGMLAAGRVDTVASLPEVGPLIRRSRRTGLAAVKMDKKEPIDRATWMKRKAWGELRTKDKGDGLRLIDKRFMPENLAGQYEFSGGGSSETIASSEDSFVALIHADGNDVGKALSKLHAGRDEWMAFKEFSAGLLKATTAALHEAVGKCLVDEKTESLPARPILLGGDDITILVRADRAIDFTRVFLETFESRTEEELGKNLGGGLSACAGIAFVKESFPFDRAYELAESLCEQAKKKVKEKGSGPLDTPSAIAFHKVTNSLPQSADDAERKKFSMGAYVLGKRAEDKAPHLDQILDLAKKTDGIGRGSLRTLLPTLQLSKEAARTALDRALEISRGREKNDSTRANAFKAALQTLTGEEELLFKNGRTPLLDALVLGEFLPKAR